MAFRLPVFNLTVYIWRGNLNPTLDPPSVVSEGNLAWGRRTAAPASGGTDSLGVVFTAPLILLPARTDVRSAEKGEPVGDDYVEAPAGSGRLYYSVYVEDIGRGFDNEHRAAILTPAAAWPQPIP